MQRAPRSLVTPLALVALLVASACGDDGAGTTTEGTGAGGSGGTSSGPGEGGDGPTTTGNPSSTASTASGDGGNQGQGGSGGSTGASPEGDDDGDGFSEAEGDCNDNNPNVNPDAVEVCNLVDDNCTGGIDEGFDVDGDGFSTCGLDCDDTRAEAYPGADELENGLDDDCDDVADEPFTDDDGDGFTEAQGDCDDLQPEINPNALEFVGNNADDDCDGTVDEALVPCDDVALDANNPLDYARAMGLCNGEVVSAQFVSGPASARTILPSFGTHVDPMNQPTEGTKLVHLSSGFADASTKNPGSAFDGGLSGGLSCTQSAHPAPLGDPGECGAADPAIVCDKMELELVLRVPSNAQSFQFQFQFFSAEYSVFRCTGYDDTFLAMLSSQALNGGAPTNISFDADGSVVSVNTGFFEACNDHPSPPPNVCSEPPSPTVDNTGYDTSAAATNPLTTTSPVLPGETITLRFMVFDEGDDRLDSSVLLDNFRWSLDPADGPSTKE